MLGLDPIRDRGEYAALHEILAGSEKGRAAIGDLEVLLSSDNPDTRQLGLRAANLGVSDWPIWSRGRGRSLVEELEEPTSRCLVIDLGSLDTINEQRLISEAVLSTLWRNRSRRQPCLIVIDEAHNVCPAPTGRRSDGARHELCITDRSRRPEVRALPVDLDAAPHEGA